LGVLACVRPDRKGYVILAPDPTVGSATITPVVEVLLSVNYRVPDHVHYRNLHGEIVLLDTKANAYLGLNRTAAIVWEVIAGGGSATEAANALVDRFDVDSAVAESDLAALVEQLLVRGLLEEAP
jgi:hypothetical protein